MVSLDNVYAAIRRYGVDFDGRITEDVPLRDLDSDMDHDDLLHIFEGLGVQSSALRLFPRQGLTDAGRSLLVGFADDNMIPLVPYFEQLEQGGESYFRNLTPKEIKYVVDAQGQ